MNDEMTLPDTPRTDAVAEKFGMNLDKTYIVSPSFGCFWRVVEHARQLERELIASAEQIKKLKERIRYLEDECNRLNYQQRSGVNGYAKSIRGNSEFRKLLWEARSRLVGSPDLCRRIDFAVSNYPL